MLKIVIVAAVFSGLVLPAHAAGDTVTLNNPPFTPGESAAQCYADAVDNLNHGT